MDSLDDEYIDRVAAEWNDTYRLQGSPSARLKRGEALKMVPRLEELTPKQLQISRRLAARLTRSLAFQAEVNRIRSIIGAILDWPGLSADAAAHQAWDEYTSRQDEIIYEAAIQFAKKHRLTFISPQSIAQIFGQVLAGESELTTPDAAQIVYVNPLDEANLTAPVGPRRILVDLTHASYDDLIALGPRLARVQQRLGYRKDRGREPQDNDEEMSFVHQAREILTGRGKQRTWAEVTRLFNKRFYANVDEEALVSETTLKERYRVWLKRNANDRDIAG